MKFSFGDKLFHDGGPYQWTGFYMIGSSFMKKVDFVNKSKVEGKSGCVYIYR